MSQYRCTALINQDPLNLEATETVRATLFISSRSETCMSNVVVQGPRSIIFVIDSEEGDGCLPCRL